MNNRSSKKALPLNYCQTFAISHYIPAQITHIIEYRVANRETLVKQTSIYRSLENNHGRTVKRPIPPSYLITQTQ